MKHKKCEYTQEQLEQWGYPPAAELFCDFFREIFTSLSLENRSKLIFAIFDYTQGGKEPDFINEPSTTTDDDLLKSMWKLSKPKLDYKILNYRIKCENNSRAGKKSHEGKKS